MNNVSWEWESIIGSPPFSQLLPWKSPLLSVPLLWPLSLWNNLCVSECRFLVAQSLCALKGLIYPVIVCVSPAVNDPRCLPDFACLSATAEYAFLPGQWRLSLISSRWHKNDWVTRLAKAHFNPSLGALELNKTKHWLFQDSFNI